jgi:hypothetical protein
VNRNEMIASLAKAIKRKTWNGTNLGPSRTQRYNLADDFCLTFNSPNNAIQSLAYSLRHLQHLVGHMTYNIVISEKIGSSRRTSLLRVRLMFWETQKEWNSRKVVEEITLSGSERDWVYGDADYPVDHDSKVVSRLVSPTVTDSELRRLGNALGQLEAEGTWSESFHYEEK